ncbi:probable tubulin polyglutamylase [Lynx pardinus]|uniref:Probable tubulin polyglutamylase n=1 Tax=Lynx pardinus TaxID=191816 RepID=A0A485MWZ1_LYNPA|nr:probable tubulin polyglutamylase [Lynx pardinus]
MPVGSTAPFKEESAVKKAVKICPESKRASQPREMTSRKKDLLLSTREPPQTKPKLKGRHTPHKASFRSCPSSKRSKVPDLHEGNFVLIFPFNEATFGASRNRLNVRRIIQEFQKRMNKQHSQVAEKETKRS